MKKMLLYTIILCAAFLVVFFVVTTVQIQKEKKIFGGMTKQQFKEKVARAYEAEYKKNRLAYWLRRPDNWVTPNLDAKVLETGRTYEDVARNDIDYLWNKNDDPLISTNPNAASNIWVKSYVEGLGLDFERPEIIAAISNIQKF